MSVSIFELFKIGIGPSSSHTVGPMRAARQFVAEAEQAAILAKTHSIKIDLYGSLALTGKGHGTDIAIMVGLQGEAPDSVDPDKVPFIVAEIRNSEQMKLLGKYAVPFDEEQDITFHYQETLVHHPNGMSFTLLDASKQVLKQHVYYSIGGGFVADEASFKTDQLVQDKHKVKYPFKTAQALLDHCKTQNQSIAEIMLENEKAWRSEQEIKAGLLYIWQVMKDCIERGTREEGILPGGLKVKRRAADLKKKLLAKEAQADAIKDEMNWINLYALAVNEENAAGGRVVTAPTNGAAGIIPAVLNYYLHFIKNANEEGVVKFLLTAGAMGILFKEGASISAAEMGCQGEVGVACSMAAAGLCAALGGTPAQVENAAEIGIEHHLGLTCDPIAGLVQIPCIERNTMGSVQAINSAKLALMGDGEHFVSLDQAIAAMRQTGLDMKDKYRETSQGGLAITVNQPAC
ncbi:MAG: L-serine ammonia-lyase [Gammaproteobacteria bacterium]|jgi:L-serine dehydratase|nr:L-serine ammonia-lyase [Gammaproteobacteria bacterium]